MALLPLVSVRLVLPVLVLLAFGCAYASPIQPAATSKSPFWWPIWGKPQAVVSEVPDGEQFRISHRASSGFSSVGNVRRSAEQRARQFCEYKGLGMTSVTERTSHHPHILGNFPRFEMVFVCTPAEADRHLNAPDPYDRLLRLKELLDAGVISQEEFDREKRELLER